MSSEVPTPSEEPTKQPSSEKAPEMVFDGEQPKTTADTPKSEAEVAKPEAEDAKPQAGPDKPKEGSIKAEGDAPKKKDNTKKPGRWRRRLTGVALILVAFAVVVRIVIWVALPTVLRKTASFYDLDLNYERLSFSSLDGEVAIWHLTVTPKGGGETIAATDYVHGQISVMNLLRGRLDVWRMEADGVDLAVTRNADGTVPLIERFLSGSAAQKQAAATKSGPIDLTPPAAIDAFRLQHVRAHVRDLSVWPPLDTTVALDLRVSDVGSPLRPTQFEVDLSSDPVLDSLYVEGEGTAAGATLDANVRVRLRGLHGKPAAGYLAPMGISPVADSIDMRMNGHVTIAAAGQLPATRPATGAAPTEPVVIPVASGALAEALAARVVLENMGVTADGQEAAAVDHITIVADKLAPGLVDIGSVNVDGVRCGAYRDAAGTLRAAGLQYGLPSGTPAQTTSRVPSVGQTAAAPPPPAAAPTTQLVPAFKWSLGELLVRNVKATFADQAITPVGSLAFLVNQLTVKNIIGDPDRPDAELTIAGQFSSPGMARSIRIDGAAKPFAAHKTFSLAVRAQGVKPDAIKQYLDLIYVKSELKDASFSCDLKGSATVDAGQTGAEMHLSNVTFDDGKQLLALNGIQVNGIKLVPARELYHVDSIEVSGPALSARRDASGELSGLGFKLDLQRLLHQETPAAPSAKARPSVFNDTAIAATKVPPDAVKRATSPPPPAKVLPRIELGRLTWKDIKISLDDQFVSPHSLITFSDAGFELSDFRFDMNDTKPGQPGKFKAWAAAPTIADQLGIEGTITPSVNSTLVDMKVIGRGLSAGIVAPYVKPFGVEPTLTNGSLDLHAKAALKYVDDVLSSNISLDNIRYAQGDRELAGVDAFRIDGLAMSKDTAAIDSIEIDRPRISVSRDAEGALLAGGARIPLPLPETPKHPTVTKPAAGESSPGVIAMLPTPTTAPTTGPTSGPTTAPTPFVTVLNKIRIRGASLTWDDHGVQPPAGTTASVDVDLDHFTFGKPADPATLLLNAKAGDSLDDLTVNGKVFASADSATAKLDVKAAGMRAGSLASYLPPGVAVSLKDGRFHVNIDAALELHDKGGDSGHLLVDDLNYRDGDSASPLLKLDSVVARVSRVDVAEGVAKKAVAVDEISLAGLETSAEKAPDGSLHLLGLAIGGPAPATQPAPATEPAPATQPAKKPTTKTIATVAVPTAPINAEEVVAQSHKVLPLITLDKLDLNVSKVTVTDNSRPGSAPLVVSDLRLRNLERIQLLGHSPASRPPVKLELICKADPAVGGVKVDMQIAPFADQPTLQVDVLADGIKGDGLTALAPELKEQQIDGSGLTDGQFKAKFEAQAKMDRRSPIDFDPQRPFELDFDLTHVEFRAAENGPVLAGVEEVRTEAARIRPATGDVLVHLLEITKPTARVLRDKQGIRVAGLLYKMPAAGAATTEPATKPAAVSKEPTTTPATKPVVVVVKAQPGPTSKPTSEMRIDKITISGLDVLVEDRSVEPAFIAPLNGMEVEILGLSNMDLYESTPIRFDATVNAGKVPLPKKNGSGTEDRDLFAQVAASGRVLLYPDYEGWAKATVSGFELASLTGEAKEYGMKLSGGTFDEAVDCRFKGGAMDAHIKTVITDLAYAEPPNGPIVRLFHLGAPIDVVIGAVQDADGSITLPVDVPVAKGHVETASVVGSATGAVGLVLATAVVSAPLKAANLVAGLLGGEKKKEPEKPVVITFPVGSTSLEPAALAELTPVIKRLHDEKGLEIQLKQELGGGDVDRARIRANPSPGETSALIYRLHERKLELQRLRAQDAGKARAYFASRADTESASTISQLHSIDRELAQTEDALDKLYELLRPGADRQAERRTRSASLDVAWARLDAVKAQLEASGLPGIDKRIQKYNAQFNPEGAQGGTVTLTLVPTKK